MKTTIAEGAAAAAGRFTSTALDDDLVDVAYTEVDTPIGPLFVAVTRRGLVRVSFPNEDHGWVVDDLATRVSPRVLEAPARLDAVRRQLDEYFDGRRRHFDLSLDWSLTTGFRRRVLRTTARIPYGSVSTYQQVAARAGNARAARAAGSALGSNPMPIVVPCHRVVRTGGNLGGFGGGLDVKARLLELEGVLL